MMLYESIILVSYGTGGILVCFVNNLKKLTLGMSHRRKEKVLFFGN